MTRALAGTKFTRNVSWSTRKALKVLTRNYGPEIKFASVKINAEDDFVEVALFGGLLTQEEADQMQDLLTRGRTHFFIPDTRAGEAEPSVAES